LKTKITPTKKIKKIRIKLKTTTHHKFELNDKIKNKKYKAKKNKKSKK
jgi:hypothetical protein